MEASIAVLFWSDNGIKVTIVNREPGVHTASFPQGFGSQIDPLEPHKQIF